ncbi:hypothetical protein [Streptomyces sp. MST-110588]|uniref:hypothetical protein n=1 Tax=Streptomyces sp. MST-110588 TaxID=2833628 RepID=UPI001F5C0F79|nr:hypothetical protein [Streptomyces sp. MST-110588]
MSHDSADGLQWLSDRRAFKGDIDALRAIHPALMSFGTGLHRHGAQQLKQLLN